MHGALRRFDSVWCVPSVVLLFCVFAARLRGGFV